MERDWHYETGELAERMRAFPWAPRATPGATSQEGGMR